MSTTERVKAGGREWFGLAVLALPTLLVSMDLFVMLLAIPRLSAALHVSSVEQLWIIDMYGFMVAGFLITMGTLGDRIGRRKLLLIGGAAFGAASLLAAFSTSPGMLIAARALLGIAGAAMTPSTLALISTLFQDSKQRATAFGIWAGCFTVGAIIGPLLGGVLLERFWWGSVFLIGVPAMVLLLIFGPWVLPEFSNPNASKLDLTSVSLSLVAILSTVYGLKELARNGWEVLSALVMAIGLIVGLIFVQRERRLQDPLIDVRLFKNRSFSTTLGSMLLYTTLSGTTMVYVAQHLQMVEGLTPLMAGIAMIPGMISATLGFQLAPLLARRIRPAYVISGGMVLTVIGLFIIAMANSTNGLIPLIVGFAVASIGGAPLVTLGINLVVGSVPPENAGSAAALAQTSNELGISLGVATLGSLAAVVYRYQLSANLRAGLPQALVESARESIYGAAAAAAQLPSPDGTALLDSARAAFTSSVNVIAGLSGVFFFAAALLVLTQLRHVPPVGYVEGEAMNNNDEEVGKSSPARRAPEKHA